MSARLTPLDQAIRDTRRKIWIILICTLSNAVQVFYRLYTWSAFYNVWYALSTVASVLLVWTGAFFLVKLARRAKLLQGV